MEYPESFAAARGLTDEQDRLLSADVPLAVLQERCGGSLPGVLAIPELLDLVEHARLLGLRIARSFTAYDGEDMVTGLARINPRHADVGGGCELVIESWQRSAAGFASSHALAAYLDGIDRASAEVTARLDKNQRIQTMSIFATDAEDLAAAHAAAPGGVWSDLVILPGIAHQTPLHWRLLDGAACRLPRSERAWRARLLPVQESGAGGEPLGFELLLIPEEALHGEGSRNRFDEPEIEDDRLFGRTLTPALRQPLARIIANAETIRARLAGPLAHDYCDYAATIADAAQHLSTMLDDLADLEVVESPGFTITCEPVDLVDAAAKAVGILGVRARDRGIALEISGQLGTIMAAAEFRRVLQILINLTGNAVAYSPQGSTVRISAWVAGEGRVALQVSDEGPGVSEAQAARIFEKFERLGRDSAGGADKGSGLGLYIARLLARAMGGELSLTSEPGKGAAFTLELPQLA